MSVPGFRRALPRTRLVALALVALLTSQSSLGVRQAAAAPVAGFDAVTIGATVAVAAAAPTTIDRGLTARLDAALVRARMASRAPGLSIAIVAADGRVWEEASGVTRRGSPLSPDAPQTIASITKTFTAAIVMQLVEEGRIELDVPANRYLPKVNLVRGATVRQLLAHTSGISDLYGPAKGKLGGAPSQALTSNDVLRPIGPSRFAPGRGFAYSNTNYYLLGHIIEAVTHRPFGEVLAERITEPLGLEATRLLSAADDQLPAAWSTAFWTAGAMVATPAELAGFGHELYGGDLLSERGRGRMMHFKEGHGYALGSQLVSLGSREAPGHSGLLYHTTSLLVHLPDERVTIAIFGTAPHADLEAALVERHGGPSLLDLAVRLGR